MQRRFSQHRPTWGLGGAHCQQRFQTGLALLGGQRFDHGHDVRLCRMRLERIAACLVSKTCMRSKAHVRVCWKPAVRMSDGADACMWQ